MARAAEFTYRNVTSRRLHLPTLGVVVDPGETFTTDRELVDDGNFERVTQKSAGAAGKED